MQLVLLGPLWSSILGCCPSKQRDRLSKEGQFYVTDGDSIAIWRRKSQLSVICCCCFDIATNRCRWFVQLNLVMGYYNRWAWTVLTALSDQWICGRKQRHKTVAYYNFSYYLWTRTMWKPVICTLNYPKNVTIFFVVADKHFCMFLTIELNSIEKKRTYLFKPDILRKVYKKWFSDQKILKIRNSKFLHAFWLKLTF